MIHLPATEIYTRLAAIDEKFARILLEYGEPEQYLRPEGFRTLVYIIIEQQISLLAANKIFARLEDSLIRIAPEIILQTPLDVFRSAGLNRQKVNTLFELSSLIIDRHLDLNRLGEIDDDEIRKSLTAVKGIGNWTVDIYLLEALNRPDILPDSDLALARCIQELWGFENHGRTGSKLSCLQRSGNPGVPTLSD